MRSMPARRCAKRFPVNEIDHNGADVAMAEDLIAALRMRAAFPVTAHQALEAGLTVIAIDKAMASGTVVDCSAMWRAFDGALGVIPRVGGDPVLFNKSLFV